MRCWSPSPPIHSHAYAYARSSAGALGLPQFVEDSYQMVRASYPKALLEPNFDLGMTNLSNAVTGLGAAAGPGADRTAARII